MIKASMEAPKLSVQSLRPAGHQGGFVDGPRAKCGVMGWLVGQRGQEPRPALAQLTQQELEVNPVLLKAADFNEGFFPLC